MHYPYPVIRPQSLVPSSTVRVFGLCTFDPRTEEKHREGQTVTTSSVQSIHHDSALNAWAIDTYNTRYILDFPEGKVAEEAIVNTIIEKIQEKEARDNESSTD